VCDWTGVCAALQLLAGCACELHCERLTLVLANHAGWNGTFAMTGRLAIGTAMGRAAITSIISMLSTIRAFLFYAITPGVRPAAVCWHPAI